jgi:Tfp pilus assembly protein PilF
LIKLKLPNEAESFLKETMKLDPKKPDAYYELGLIAQQKGDFKGAMAKYDEAI